MHVRSLSAALATVVAALSCTGFAFADDPFEWPELPYEPCYRVERVIHPLDVCAQGGSFIFGRSINAHGTIVGSASCTAVGQDRAFIWRMNEPFQWIPTPQGTNYSWAWAINDDGLVAGSLGNGNGFAWHEGTGEFQLIPPPYATGSVRPRGINADGVVVGTFVTNEPNVTPGQGFIWKAGKLTRLEELYDFGGRAHFPTDIDDDGTITGYFPAGNGGTAEARPFLIKDGVLYEFDPFPEKWGGTEGMRLNTDGGFVAQTWNHPDLPTNVSLAVFGDETGYLGEFQRPRVFRRTTPNSVNAFGDGVGVGKRTDGGSDDVVIFRSGVVRRIAELLIPSSESFQSGNAHGIARTGDICSSRYHLVPAAPPLGDLSRNCRRDIDDLLLLLGQWGPGKDNPANLNGDERVDLQDVLLLLNFIAEDFGR